ncbi:unnamed protein product [Closterium sp. NIES-53]
MWIFKVKRPPRSPPVFKTRYVARGSGQRTFPPETQWSLRRPVYGLRQGPREWHDTLRTTLAALGFRPSSADPSLFVLSGPTPFFVLVYVDDLVFATADRTALVEVKSELQKRHTSTDLGELRRYLGLQIARDRAARTITPTQSHMVRQGPSRVSGQGRERSFLLVVDDYTRYTMVFLLRSKEVVSSPPTSCGTFFVGRAFSSRSRFRPPLRLNGTAERRIGLVMEVARTSMIHAAAPHFLWPFAVRYVAQQLNLWPCISLPETWPTLRWTGKVGDASVFHVQGSRAFFRDTSADKLSARTIPCVFLGFPPNAPSWQFYHPTSRRVFPSQDVTFVESVPFYRLFPYRFAPPLPTPLFLAPGPPPVDPLPPKGPAPSRVSQVDPLPGAVPVEIASDSGAARGAVSRGAASRDAEPGGAEPRGAESEGFGSGGAEPGGVEPGGAEPEGVEPGSAESEGAESGGAEPWVTASAGGLAAHPPWSGAAGAGVARTRGNGAARTGAVGDGAGGTCAGGAGAIGAGATGTGAGGAGAVGAGAVDPGAGGAGPGGAVSGGSGVGGTMRPRPYFVPLHRQVLGVPSSSGLTPPLLCPPPDQSQPPLQPASLLPAPSPYTEQTGGLTEHCEHASRPASPVRTGHCAPRLRPPPVLGTHAMALRPSTVPLRVPLPPTPDSSLHAVPDPESDRARAASPTVSRLLATVVTDPSFESTNASALVAELVDFAAACRLDYATDLVAESASASPPSVGRECALDTDVLEDRQEDFECLAAAVPRFASMLLAPEGDPDAPDMPTPRSYAKAITEGVDYFQTFSPTPKMTSLRVLLHVTAQHDYELHFLDFSAAVLQGSLHEEIWLRHPPGFTVSFPVGTQWSLRRPVYSLRQVPREWHDTLRTTLTALWFALSTADPSLFLCIDTSLSPFCVLVYVDNLVFATADTEALTRVKLELQKRHTCTDLGELRSYLGLQITRDRARRTITLTQSHMVHQVLQRFSFQFSSPQPTPLSTGHSLSAPPSDESVEPSGPYPELVGCLMYLMTCTRPGLAYALSLLARYVAPGRHRKVHSDAAKRVLRYLCSTSRMGLVLGGRGPVLLTGHTDASWELRWLTYLLTDLGEQPRSPPVLYVDNKAMTASCQEHRLEHRTKHIALRYFLARELQQRGQLRLAYVATRANNADIFTKALLPACFAFLDWSCDHLFSPTLPMGFLATTSGMGLVRGGTQPVVMTSHCDSSYANDVETQRSTQGYCFSLGAGAVSWRSTRSSSVASSTEAEIYAGAMAT